MKSLKNIGLAVTLLVAGSQAEAGFWSKLLKSTPKVETVSVVEAVAPVAAKVIAKPVAKQGLMSFIGSGFGKAYNGVGSVAKASYNACNKENGKKVLTFSKKQLDKSVAFVKKNKVAVAIVAACLGIGAYFGIKKYLNKKAKNKKFQADQKAKADEVQFLKIAACDNRAVAKKLKRGKAITVNQQSYVTKK